VDDTRCGSTLRAIRVRAGLRQVDVARRSHVSRQKVSLIERGFASRLPLHVVRAVAVALGVSVDVQLRWRGGDIDRVVNAGHADLHESVARALAGLPGWVWLAEVTFAHFGERGVIDILAWHAESRSLLIIELKTELVDPQGLVATMHRRVRLGHVIAREQGWRPATISAWVVVSDTSTERRRLARHVSLLRGAFPADGRLVRRWLRAPRGRISALTFWSYVAPGSLRKGRRRVRLVPPALRATAGARAERESLIR
jgi:transcriptional regulator with XRE-family HTH domain